MSAGEAGTAIKIAFLDSGRTINKGCGDCQSKIANPTRGADYTSCGVTVKRQCAFVIYFCLPAKQLTAKDLQNVRTLEVA